MQLPQDNPELATLLSEARSTDSMLDADYTRYRLLEAVQSMRHTIQEAAAIIEGIGHDLEQLAESLRHKPESTHGHSWVALGNSRIFCKCGAERP